jgi:hypothetical protein
MIYRATRDDLYNTLRTYRTKKEIPNGMRTQIFRIPFGLYGIYYVPTGGHGLLCKNQIEMTYHTATLTKVGLVIGPKDLEATAHREFAQERRNYFKPNYGNLRRFDCTNTKN